MKMCLYEIGCEDGGRKVGYNRLGIVSNGVSCVKTSGSASIISLSNVITPSYVVFGPSDRYLIKGMLR
jgi:hypothetical protein